MAQNHIQPGAALEYTNSTGAAIVSGQVVKVGSRIGVAFGDIAAGAKGQLAMAEVWELPKLSTDDMSAVGTEVYWDDTAKNITITATANTLAGYVFAAAGAGATTVQVKLNA